jgi:hypothetical protein
MTVLARCALGFVLAACVASRAEPAPAKDVVTFEGMCDASGAVPIDATLFAVADDESNVLRIYDAEKGGRPVDSVDMTPALHLKKKKHPEADLEAATPVAGRALWIGSHGRSKKGKSEPDRLRFFATTMPSRTMPMKLEGAPYAGLLDDMLSDARLARFGLARAAELAPQEEGGLNIEGMTATPDGGVLLGFRNPVPQGKALVLELLNPLEPMHGKPARFGEPLLLELGGLGIRSLSSWHDQYVIAAGHYEHGATSKLYFWKGDASKPRPIAAAMPDDFNPEGFFTPEDRDRFMVLSDDGSLKIKGKRCKDLKDSDDMRFRGLWLRPTPNG